MCARSRSVLRPRDDVIMMLIMRIDKSKPRGRLAGQVAGMMSTADETAVPADTGVPAEKGLLSTYLRSVLQHALKRTPRGSRHKPTDIGPLSVDDPVGLDSRKDRHHSLATEPRSSRAHPHGRRASSTPARAS
jgi:hypothetical protein